MVERGRLSRQRILTVLGWFFFSGGLPCMRSPTLLQTILMALFLFIVSIAFFMPLNCNK